MSIVRLFVLVVAIAGAACEKQSRTLEPSPSPTATPTPQPSPSPTPRDDAPMVRIAGGTFRMGSDAPDADPDERPAHEVTVAPFDLDAHEVTAAAYARFLAALGTHRCAEARDGLCVDLVTANTRWPLPIELAPDGTTYRARAGVEDHPVHGVSRTGARRYCAWTRKRLPTEAEWELAARFDPETKKTRTYPWGDTFEPRRANCAEDDCQDGFVETAPVGSFPSGATPAGVHDLAGNVFEWVEGCYTASYAPGAPCEEAEGGVIRGFYFVSPAGSMRASRRNAAQDTTSPGVGFRCARDARD
jgi:iron(II)-dependent oxidoreductase